MQTVTVTTTMEPAAKGSSENTLLFGEHPFLRELGIEAQNDGVFHGRFFSSGDLFSTLHPANNKPIARVKGVRSRLDSLDMPSRSIPLLLLLTMDSLFPSPTPPLVGQQGGLRRMFESNGGC